MKHMHVYTRKILAKEYIPAQTYTNGDTDSKTNTYEPAVLQSNDRNATHSQ
jgi:hypothetical protein